MDINLLVLSVGNSRLAVGLFAEGELKQSARAKLDDRDAVSREITRLWRALPESAQPTVAGASVNPTAEDWLEELVLKLTNHTIEWVGEEIDTPIKVLTEKPAETGIDRVLNIAAAFEQMQKACVVVDAGTAITVDVCNDAGEFLGGAIAPGASLMLAALHEHTAKLPQVELAAPDGAIGQNTQQAMLQGVYHGIRGMVKELVENYATSLGFWPDLIATGGDAKVLFEGWELVHAISPDLTLYGVALAYTEHHIKHDS
jgi:type III pantothenate kinase